MMVLRQIGVLIWKDLLIDLRRKENLIAMFFFSLLTLLIFRFALSDDAEARFRITPRVLATLTAQGMAQSMLGDLAALEGRTIIGREALLAALDALPGGPAPAEARISVLDLARRDSLTEAAPGLLWVTLLMAGVLGLSRSYNQEKEQGCMDGLLLTPVERGVLYLGKMLSNMFFLVVILALLLPLFSLFFQVRLAGVVVPRALVLLAGVLGFASLGTLLGGITASLKGREVLLPILLYPLLVPLVVAAVFLTGSVLEGATLAQNAGWLNLLAACDTVYLIVSYLVFDYVMET